MGYALEGAGKIPVVRRVKNMLSPPKISVENLTHSFLVPGSETRLPVLESVSFEVKEAELLCLIGPSGGGKSTLLKILAGLTTPVGGMVRIDGLPVLSAGPDRILLFQDLGLFNWMTAHDNVEFALKAKGMRAQSRTARVAEILESVGLGSFESYYPHEISGGMRQRLALARALAADPAVLLMDEPFNALDVLTRAEMESEFLSLREARGFTTILVTHDVRQAAFLGDRVLVMSDRPATIKADVPVPFPRPRPISIRRTGEFHALEDELSTILREDKYHEVF